MEEEEKLEANTRVLRHRFDWCRAGGSCGFYRRILSMHRCVSGVGILSAIVVHMGLFLFETTVGAAQGKRLWNARKITS